MFTDIAGILACYAKYYITGKIIVIMNPQIVHHASNVPER
jgi:hypothetical protein